MITLMICLESNHKRMRAHRRAHHDPLDRRSDYSARIGPRLFVVLDPHAITLAFSVCYLLRVSSFLIAVAASLAWQAADGTTTLYQMSDWAAPFGIVLVADRLSTMMVLLTSVLALFVFALCYWIRLGRSRAAFPCAVPVPANGHYGRFPDRRFVQPLRLFRSPADRVIRIDDPCGWQRAAESGCAICALQPHCIDLVPLRAWLAICGDGYAEHGGSGTARGIDRA